MMQIINSFNLWKFEFILLVSFWGKNWKMKNSTLYAPRTQSVSFSASASFGAERSEAAKTRTRGNVTLCVRGSIYYFFVRRPQNEFSRPVWKSWNSKCITLFYIVYFAASIRAAKIHFAAWGQKKKTWNFKKILTHPVIAQKLLLSNPKNNLPISKVPERLGRRIRGRDDRVKGIILGCDVAVDLGVLIPGVGAPRRRQQYRDELRLGQKGVGAPRNKFTVEVRRGLFEEVARALVLRRREETHVPANKRGWWISRDRGCGRKKGRCVFARGAYINQRYEGREGDCM